MNDKESCKEYRQRLAFYACEELGDAERAAVEQHVTSCVACAAELEREKKLWAAVTNVTPAADRLDPSELLLVRCRSELAEALDDEADRRAVRAEGHGLLRGLFATGWLRHALASRPAWSAALLVLLGLGLGAIVPQWYADLSTSPTQGPEYTVSATPRLSEQELQAMDVAGINWVPASGAGTPSVELRLVADRPLVLQGSVDDTDVRRVLTYVLQNGQRFDNGVRLDSVELLRSRSGDTEVRHALCLAARKDQNPGVRLKALEALRDFRGQDPVVRATLVNALREDSCPGVRVEAINSLQAVLRSVGQEGTPPGDPALLGALRDTMQRDANKYVRMQSAALVRQLGPRPAR